MARPKDFDDIVSRIPGVKVAGNKAIAPCPLSGHKTPAGHLNLTDAGDKALVTDQGGRHTYEDICQALGFDSLTYNSNGAEAKIAATYDYTDANGKLLYQVVRYDPKDFKQRRPDGAGDWLWNIKGIKPVLYHLPEVLEAVKQGKMVYICEGERDCDNLAKLELSATTNSGGAEKWRPELSEALADASVVILPDKDTPGRRHAAKVVSSLYGKTKSLKVLELPDRDGHKVKDASDWLEAHGTLSELERLTAEVPEYKPKEIAADSKDSEVKETSFLVLGDNLYEQIVSDGEATFIEYDTTTNESQIVTHIMQGDIKVIPISSEEITLGAVKLPSGATEYGDTLSLLQEIEAHIYRYLDVSNSFRKFAAYYILLSWLYDRFNTLPYLRFIGDTGCGKSRALDVCGGLCYKATSASGCITPAPIYRMLKKWAGTIILDEADLQNSDEYHEVTKILNCGFERNRPVIRAVKDNPERLQILPTFGPKVFATRRRFKDAALEARCLTEIMQETSRENIPATLGDTFYREQAVLRNKLLLFRFRNYSTINQESHFELPGIEPRLRQISACFASLFARQPDVLRDYEAFIQHHQRELIEQRAATVIGQVVEKLFSLIESDTIETFDTLDTTLVALSAGDIAGSLAMTPQAVGQILKTLGLQTKFVKGKSKRCIVYDQVKLNTLRRRYIPSEDDAVTISQGSLMTEGHDTVSMVSMVSSTGDSIQRIDTDGPEPPMYPTGPCLICGSRSYWLRDELTKPTWICQGCHPEPECENMP